MNEDTKREIEIRKKAIERLEKNILEIQKEQGGTGKTGGILKVKGTLVSTVEEIEDLYQFGDISERTKDKNIEKLEKILENDEIELFRGLIGDIERSIKDLERYIK